jgi:hypothetical protein
VDDQSLAAFLVEGADLFGGHRLPVDHGGLYVQAAVVGCGTTSVSRRGAQSRRGPPRRPPTAILMVALAHSIFGPTARQRRSAARDLAEVIRAAQLRL